ncbi:hypothetical protein [Paenibacillus sp. L3-i20]|uniref:hypothetical protein n=1 Tax=Paenibacillus sp. L3-i20 TaxID=2905833 RepID=UPI001EDF5152|nr:hypothetical protein [Paenibacillus sp. L3-i20]GKU77541.1 hypothetical protein L3i20_v219380 [Paenibacillus sp. L3-i20]
MSIDQDFKSVLFSSEVAKLVLVYEQGNTDVYELGEGEEARKVIIKNLLETIQWNQVTEVKFELALDNVDATV